MIITLYCLTSQSLGHVRLVRHLAYSVSEFFAVSLDINQGFRLAFRSQQQDGGGGQFSVIMTLLMGRYQ